jgi:hypothetical protein
MAFSVFVEMLNLRARKAAEPVHLRPTNRERQALAVEPTES